VLASAKARRGFPARSTANAPAEPAITMRQGSCTDQNDVARIVEPMGMHSDVLRARQSACPACAVAEYNGCPAENRVKDRTEHEG